jgi:hypothetical protein
MSFRARLTLFFILVVIVPMVSLTFVLFGLIADNQEGKARERVSARRQGASTCTRPSARRPTGRR